MNKLLRPLCYLTLALIASLGWNAQPAQAAGPACAPAFVKQSGNVFTVLPNGTDDTANVQCAFAKATAAGPGATVQLVKGDYHVGLLQILNFDGYFKGAGIGKTVIHPLTHMDCQALRNQNMYASWFTFRLGNPRISDLTFYVDDPEPCASYDNDLMGRIGNEITPLFLTGAALGKDYSCDQLKVPQFGLGTVTRIEVKTPPASEVDYSQVDSTKYVYYGYQTGTEDGPNPGCPIWENNVAGDYTISNSIFYLPVGVTGIYSANTGGIHRMLNNTITGSLNPIFSMDVNRTLDVISGNAISGSASDAILLYGGGAWMFWETQPPAETPSLFTVTNNKIAIEGNGNGITALDVPNAFFGLPQNTMAAISGNTITMNGPSNWGIFVEGVDKAVVNHNVIQGKGQAGIAMNAAGWDWASDWTSTMKDCLVSLNDISMLKPFDRTNYLAPIFLGPHTSNCTVVGKSLSDTVMDLGTNNHLINLTRLFGLPNLQTLPHNLKWLGQLFRWGH